MSSTVGSSTVDRHEPTLERLVLLDVLAVLVDRRRADAVQRAAGERRLQEVRRVHGAFARAPAPTSVCSSSMNRRTSPPAVPRPRPGRPLAAPRTRRGTWRRRSGDPCRAPSAASVLQARRARRPRRCGSRDPRRSPSYRRRGRRPARDCSSGAARAPASCGGSRVSRPMTGSSLPARASSVRSRAYWPRAS